MSTGQYRGPTVIIVTTTVDQATQCQKREPSIPFSVPMVNLLATQGVARVEADGSSRTEHWWSSRDTIRSRYRCSRLFRHPERDRGSTARRGTSVDRYTGQAERGCFCSWAYGRERLSIVGGMPFLPFSLSYRAVTTMRIETLWCIDLQTDS